MDNNDDLSDYEYEEQTEQVFTETAEAQKKDVKATYVSIHSSSFRDFLPKFCVQLLIAVSSIHLKVSGKCFFFFVFHVSVCVSEFFFISSFHVATCFPLVPSALAYVLVNVSHLL